MKRWKMLWRKAVSMVFDPAMFVCTVCGQKVTRATVCHGCGVCACPDCRTGDCCPYCGEPGA